MLSAERLNRIVEIVNSIGSADIDTLMKTLNVSRSTIRRDLLELERNKKIVRTRGGVVSTLRGSSIELPFNMKKDVYLDEKQRIAIEALNYVNPNDTIILDAGTTVYEFAQVLNQNQKTEGLFVATNDLQSAMELAPNPNINLIIIGGVLRKGFYSLTGNFTETILREIHTDTLFLGVDAISLERGLMVFSMEEYPIKKMMVKAANKVIVLCDHTKFEAIAFVNICALNDVDVIITGKEANPQKVEAVRDLGVKVVLV